MTLTPRDKKIALVIIPLVAVLAYWFLLLSPKREEAAKAGEALAAEQDNRDQAETKLAEAAAAQTGFAADYASVVRLGKAIPTKVDMPSLLIQLDRAARGTDIDFNSIKAGEDAGGSDPAKASSSPKSSSSGGSSPSSGGSSPSSGGSSPSSGGSSPSSGGSSPSSGGSSPSSGGSGSTSSGESAKPAGGSAADTQTSSSTKEGGVPVGGGAGGPAKGGAGVSAPALDTVPLDFKFGGSYFEMASFFHRMKRFVYVADDRIAIRGRLLTIDAVKLSPGDGGNLVAEIKATVYLSPEKEGATAGASPQGPSGGAAPSSSSASTSSGSPPTATVTP